MRLRAFRSLESGSIETFIHAILYTTTLFSKLGCLCSMLSYLRSHVRFTHSQFCSGLIVRFRPRANVGYRLNRRVFRSGGLQSRLRPPASFHFQGRQLRRRTSFTPDGALQLMLEKDKKTGGRVHVMANSCVPNGVCESSQTY